MDSLYFKNELLVNPYYDSTWAVVWLGFSYLDTFTCRIFLLRCFITCFKALHLQKEYNAVNNAYFMYLDQKVIINSLNCFCTNFVVCEVKASHLLFKFQFWIDRWASLKHTSVISTTLNIEWVCPGALFPENYLICILLSCLKEEKEMEAYGLAKRDTKKLTSTSSYSCLALIQ